MLLFMVEAFDNLNSSFGDNQEALDEQVTMILMQLIKV